jgi:hypothetical protein
VSERESQPAKVEDLEKKPVTEKDAEQVKGGMSGSGAGSPVLVKQINPREVIPCI